MWMSKISILLPLEKLTYDVHRKSDDFWQIWSPLCNSPKNIGIVIEGMEVITGLGDIARACSVLLGLTYALNLDYPTFEVFQKLFLELDDSKLSNKVQSLKSNLQP
uniref:Uncharacterized protein n=1 Tax=Cyprinus carpio TaxID=7962 RepID=A0A8C1YI87_CYPCA